ncbi:tail protein [Pseudomonas phage Almagne]|nr:tail protein [Pseudomonas phage Almagne]
MTVFLIGNKGGEDPPRAAVESPDSLASISYANILDLCSEGEIKGLVKGLQSVFLNETPVQNADGSNNYSSMQIQYRLGTQDQEYLPGFPAVENERQVNFPLKANSPFVQALTNNQLSGVRVLLAVPRLFYQNPTSGDTTGTRVEYSISLKTGDGAFVEVVKGAFDGKTTTQYERTHRIDLPKSSSGWTLRVDRQTADTSPGATNATTVVSYTEVIDRKLRYPNSAIFGMKFDASQFSQTPTRAYELEGIILRVPANYDPVTRTYTGVWNGTFKLAYSNNPAWIYYDLVLNDRYGLGHLIKQYQVDRYELYRIAQYCDQLVSDGKGGTEPRFTCNLYLQQRADALRVIQDLAAIFRGMAYWGGGMVTVTSDMPEDPQYTYTNANVLDGKFEYSGTGRKTRYSICLVSWNDPKDFYRAKVEYVEDSETLRLFGHRQTEATAIGCTSQSQAQRLGRWMLLTNKMETETVNFTVGLDGTLVRPGRIVRIANNDRAGRRIGGRLRSATVNQLVLDDDVTVYTGDEITVIMPNGVAVTRVVAGVGRPVTWDGTSITWDNGTVTWDLESYSQDVQQVTLSQDLPSIPTMHSIWAVDSTTLATQLFRILTISEDFQGTNMNFKVTATLHIPGKFSSVDDGTRLELPPVTIIPPSIQVPVKNISVISDYAISQGLVQTTMTATWDPAPNAVAYEMQWKYNNGNWIYGGRVGTTSIDVKGILAGRYQVRVQAFNSMGLGSVWTNSVEFQLAGRTDPPPSVSYFTSDKLVMGIKVNWGFPATLDIETMQRSELWYSLTTNLNSATKQGDYAYPANSATMMGLSNGAGFYFWIRLVDKIGNEGPFVGPLHGITETNPDLILEYLTGEITKTQLSQELLTFIETAADLSGVNSRIDNVIQVQNNDRSTFTQQINTATSVAGSAQTSANNAAQAAQAASDLAGGKGKVLTQNATPAAADQLPQNLWIDTNGGANTPKRWSGSAWVAVTDKAATDAAAAATAAAGVANQASATAQTAMSTLATLDGELDATYTIKTQVTQDGQRYLAGIGVGVTAQPGQPPVSQVLITADRFAVLTSTAGGTVSAPFVVNNGQVFINDAFISKLTVQNALVGATLRSVAEAAPGLPLLYLNFQTGDFVSRGVGNGYRVEQNNSFWRLYSDSFASPLVELGVLT